MMSNIHLLLVVNCPENKKYHKKLLEQKCWWKHIYVFIAWKTEVVSCCIELFPELHPWKENALYFIILRLHIKWMCQKC